MVQAMLSAPMPLRSTIPDTKIPTAQLVRIRLQKNATSAIMRLTSRLVRMEVGFFVSNRSGQPSSARHEQQTTPAEAPSAEGEQGRAEPPER